MYTAEQIYLQYHDKVRAYVRGKIQDPHDVEDLVSAVFMKIVQKLDSYDPDKASVSTWVYAITRNTVTDHFRTRRSMAFIGMICFPLFKTQMPATVMLFIVGVFSMVTGVIWAIAGDMGGRALSSTVVGVLDWAVYMGAAIQASVFGYVQQHFGWPAIFVTIGVLYIVMLVLTLLARKMKMRRL